MPHDPEAFADMVVLHTKAALAPLLERLAAAEQAQRELQARVLELVGLRDRITVVETKAATIHEPVTAQHSGQSETDLELALRDKIEPLTKEIGAVRERLIAVEVRQPVPGPPGLNGKDGADGLGWDDLVVEHDGERTFTIKFMRGERVKVAGSFTIPADIYRGVYVEGKTYERGDGVTWAGSEWHCHEPTTTKPGDGSKAWTLKVKRGRDGKDGKDAPTVPVVSVGRS